MSDDQEINQPADERNYNAEASEMGWVDKPDFKGNPEKWVDAKTYVERGETVLPLIKKANQTLKSELAQTQNQLLETQRLLRANTEALAVLQKDNQERNVATIEAEINDIDERIVAARQEDDARSELQLRDRRDDLREELKAAKTAKPTTTSTQQPTNGGGPQIDQTVWNNFLEQNPWYSQDEMLQAATTAAMAQLIREGKVAGKNQAERLQMAADVVKKRFGVGQNTRRQAANRVEGGGTPDNEGSGGGGGSGKVYSDLPAAAKEACEKQAKMLKFGEGRKFKDLDAWRRHYTEIYFST